MTTGFIRIAAFAKMANLTVGTLYLYHAQKLYGFPSPGLNIGTVKFWRRKDAKAWIKEHKKRKAA